MESIWTLYPKFFGEVVGKTARWAALYLKLRKIYVAIKRDPKRYAYTDLAITPVTEDEAETHEMFQNNAARSYVESERRIAKIVHGATPSAA